MALISFKHQLIFVKTTKTAGTSVEIDLSAKLEPEAVVTPIYPPVDGHVARNHLDGAGNPLFFNHMPARKIREILGADKFDAMTRICIEREPVTKCISHFHMLRNSALHNPDGAYQLSWDEYVAQGKFPLDLPKYTMMQDDQRLSLVTHVLRYDRLSRDLPPLLKSLGIEGFSLTSRAKSEYSADVLITPDQVTEAQRQKIERAYRPTTQFLSRFAGIDWSQP
jgi:hypothetical protein